MDVREVTIANVLTRCGGYLRPVASHSLQPYSGCAYGSSLCGVGCYVRANPWVTRGREWGSFLDVRSNAAESYRRGYDRERRWARGQGRFSIFMSSSTDPFPPQEARLGITSSVLEAMIEQPPDELIIQTHSHLVAASIEVLVELATRCSLRIHLSIETDLERLPGLPAPPSSVERRFAAAQELGAVGLAVVITVAPLLPIEAPREFFTRVSRAARAVVIDHFIGGDGTMDGRRTRGTPLVAAMAAVEPDSVTLEYRDRMVACAREIMPGRVGVGPEGFAGHYA